MATARFGDKEFEVGNACPRNPAWARAMSEVLPPAAFLQNCDGDVVSDLNRFVFAACQDKHSFGVPFSGSVGMAVE